ncbi:hypothetical protein SAMN05660297_02894 [Natronincola peptidivorans]|uniref:Tetratricopeptide repeat-containing protein n=1 Tax=Natronincola peptidivorans TaxID=426128 RepID=A0A1I0FNL3_9FIRM|nr:hypothetical protein [Natronincola peptidivorans]SET59932.1 hypothetical protein SAMN05660297_02894 [Natronincola peptidivorans]
MLTIAIDEFGHFSSNNEVSFVGGYIYTGEDYHEEKLRLFNFLKETCEGFVFEDEKLTFPNDMHYDRGAQNRKKVNYFEENIEKPLKEYLTKNGKYHLICMIKSRKERADFMNISNLVDDRRANNLYEHMTSGLLRNILFSNIDTKDEEAIRLEIPTRVSVIKKHEKEKLQEFITLGYPGNEIEGGKKYKFFSTDQKTFKTALASMIMNSPKRYTTRFESMNIQSINYKEESVDMAFLYLADTICNCFKRRLKLNRQNYGMQSLHDWAKSYTGENEPYLWAYDDLDSVYQEIMEKYERKDFIGTVRALNQARHIESDFSKYYQDNWFKKIQENLQNAFDLNQAGVYISQLDAYYTRDHINYDEGITIFDELWRLVKEREDKIDKATLYHLADVGIRAYNHQGMGGKKNPYYQICEELKEYVPIETYLTTLNRSIQIYVNEFDFDGAIEKQSYTLDCLDILKKARIDISELNETNSSMSARMTSRGRVLSSLGQFYAFKRNPEALHYFEEALKEFGMDEGNSQITTSHILNFASDQKNLAVYAKYAPSYFGGMEGIHKQLDYLENSKGKAAFGFYTYIKGLHQLYMDRIDDAFLERILSLDFKKMDYDTSSNPWQLIYKNIGMILYKKSKPKLAVKYMDKALECVRQPGDTIIAINHFTNIQKAFYSGKREVLKEAIEEFKLWLQGEPNIERYFAEALTGEAEGIYEKLYDKFTFTYI